MTALVEQASEGGGAPYPRVSVIVPCRNERPYIAACLDSILSNDYPEDRVEVIVCDGMSDDGTRDVIRNYAARFPRVHPVDNPKGTAPAGLNAGIRHAGGDIVVRMDAHCRYPANYLRTLVHWLEKSGADNVGAAWRTLPGSETATARAIAFVLSHRAGVGNAHFRIGVKEPRWVDTVPFGCYRRQVFERIGMFDEDLVRNQDDEFNQRLLKAGGRILLVPDISIDYFARDSFRKLARMYYQYGYFKPLAARKAGRVGTVRQILPAAFLLIVAVAAVLSVRFWWARTALIAAVAGYSLLVVIVATGAWKSAGEKVGLLAAVTMPIVHFSYAVGSLRGLFDLFTARLTARRNADQVPISR